MQPNKGCWYPAVEKCPSLWSNSGVPLCRVGFVPPEGVSVLWIPAPVQTWIPSLHSWAALLTELPLPALQPGAEEQSSLGGSPSFAYFPCEAELYPPHVPTSRRLGN